jgi:hypothetical protein
VGVYCGYILCTILCILCILWVCRCVHRCVSSANPVLLVCELEFSLGRFNFQAKALTSHVKSRPSTDIAAVYVTATNQKLKVLYTEEPFE